MRIVKPHALQKGQRIGVVSLSSPLLGDKKERLHAGISWLETLGHPVVQAPNVLEQFGYLAGTDDQRAGALNAMFAGPDVGAVLCSRGGYGTQRILDAIDYRAIRKHPKILVGYSDMTALQLALFKKARLVTFSGPMVAVDMPGGMEGINGSSFWDALYGDAATSIDFEDLGHDVKIVQHGKTDGRLLGGCFSVLCSMLGTQYCPDFKNSILLLEDVGEDLYRIDRMFAQLKHSGVLQKIKGLILGDFPDCQDKISETPVTLHEIVAQYTRDLPIPVIANVYYGHGEKKLTFPMGVRVDLDTLNGKLTFKENALHV